MANERAHGAVVQDWRAWRDYVDGLIRDTPVNKQGFGITHTEWLSLYEQELAALTPGVTDRL